MAAKINWRRNMYVTKLRYCHPMCVAYGPTIMMTQKKNMIIQNLLTDGRISSWRGFATADDRKRLQAVIRRRIRSGLCEQHHKTVEEL